MSVESAAPEQEALPTPQEFAGGLIAGRIIRSLGKEDKLRLKTEVVSLAEKHGIRIHDVVDHLGINRIAYFDHIDPLTAEPQLLPESETKARSERYLPISHLTAAQQIGAYLRIQDTIRTGVDIRDACQRERIRPTDFHGIRKRISDLRAEAGSNGKTPDFRTVGMPGFRDIFDSDEKREACESVHLLCAAFRWNIREACIALGITDSDHSTWSKEQRMRPVFPIALGTKTALPVNRLRISIAGKIQLVDRAKYVAEHTPLSQREIFDSLGYSDGMYDDWATMVKVLRKTAQKHPDGRLEPRHMKELEEQCGKPRNKIRPWLKEHGLRDLGTQLMCPFIRIPEQELVDLWLRYEENETDITTYNRIVELYLPLVRTHAQKYLLKLPEMVTLDDLIETGNKGMMDAVRLYDLSRGIKFTTYCPRRVLGAMQDGLREFDWIPRTVRQAQTQLKKAREKWQRYNGHVKPLPRDLAIIMDCSVGEVENMIRLTQRTNVESLDAVVGDDDTSDGKGKQRYSMVANAADSSLTDRDRREVMIELMKGLSEQEQLIMGRYYQDERTMKEIGDEIGLSESRVSQMHSSIIERLKVRVRQHSETDGILAHVIRRFGDGPIKNGSTAESQTHVPEIQNLPLA